MKSRTEAESTRAVLKSLFSYLFNISWCDLQNSRFAGVQMATNLVLLKANFGTLSRSLDG